MFMLRNVGKLIFGDTSKESLIELPQGQLYLVRPLSPKGYSELIFKDASATIRRTNQEYQYQLVIQRAYEEGEAELLSDDDDGDATTAALDCDRDEKTFLLDEQLCFRTEIRRGGDKVLAWRDLSGDVGDLYEFVCDTHVAASEVQSFEITAMNCQYERKYRKNWQTATEQDLKQFSFEEEAPIPKASPASSPKVMSPVQSMGSFQTPEKPTPVKQTPMKQQARSTANSAIRRGEPKKEPEPMQAPVARAQPAVISELTKEKTELHLFDFPSGSFMLKDSDVRATVTEIGRWQYWIQIESDAQTWLGQPVVAEINPVFNFEYLSFIFNAYSADGSAYSWLLRFKDIDTLSRFQEGLMQALWEQLNEIKWEKSKEEDKDYVLEAFNDLTVNDPAEAEAEEEEDEQSDGQRSEHYDSDEENDDIETKDDDGNVNSQLAVGYKHDRSFVVRGSKIGVFKHSPANRLEFSTNISKVETPGGKLFNPKKVMLHMEDNDMILQDEANPNSLYRMDLEYGRIVDEWKVHDDIPITHFAPGTKFAQTTSEPTFIGMSRNALYRVDPRLSGNKLVDAQLKQYVSKNDFSAAATTEKGYIAVASNKGDVRLFDRLGINAKTHIPALGDPIIGIDVSADGRWILATCRTYLLLIDAQQKDGKNEGRLGFEKPFAKDSKPQPRRLGLSPAHVAQFQHETGAPLAFTPAHFNAGEGVDERSIVTATGPFIVTWDMKRVLRGAKDPYNIKRYSAEVKADNFKYGGDKNVIVALPNEVNMVDKKQLKRPTRESIAPASFLGRTSAGGKGSRIGARDSGRYKLGREDVVNSPY